MHEVHAGPDELGNPVFDVWADCIDLDGAEPTRRRPGRTIEQRVADQQRPVGVFIRGARRRASGLDVVDGVRRVEPTGIPAVKPPDQLGR